MAQYHIPDPEELLECPYDRVHMVRAKRFQYHLMKCRKTMAQYHILSPDEWVTCPYEPTHRMPYKTLTYHLIKCRKNYTGKEFATCPFNAKHELPKPELRHHMCSCPDRAVIEPELSYAQRKEKPELHKNIKGCTDTPVYNDIVIPSTEDWDAEAGAPVRVGPMHDPSYHSRVVFKDLSKLNKDQKAVMRDNRLTTDQKMSELHAYSNTRSTNSNGVDAVDEGLRLPATAAMTAIQPRPQPKEQPVSSVFAYSVGAGRGRGRGQFGQTQGGAQPQEQPPPAEPVGADGFTTVYSRNGSAMGIGRGLAPGAAPGQAPGVGRGNFAPGAAPAVGRGNFAPGVGRGSVAPPPGFCVPNVNERNQY